jgi:phosphoribosyl 1,2-cyclic phosphodiesterase
MLTDPRFAHVKEIHVLLTHAHLDHFEGLKDVDWFWKRGNGLSLVLHGTEEALSSVATVFAPPIYVTLPVLADGTLGSFTVP